MVFLKSFLNLVSVWVEKQHYDSLKSSCGAPLQKKIPFWCTISIISDLRPAHLLLSPHRTDASAFPHTVTN